MTKPYLDDIDVDLIRENPDNPRKRLGNIEELASSIRAQGVIEPLVVEPLITTEPQRYQLIAGHRRLAAARRAGMATVPAIVHDEGLTREHRIERMLVENLQREDLTAIEEGDTYQLLLDLPDGGYSVSTLAARLGRPKTHVKERVKAAALPESTRERILRGQITLEQSAKIAPFTSDAAEMERINRAAEAGPLALSTALEEAKRRREVQRAHDKVVRELRSQGVRVLASQDLPPVYRDLDEVPGLMPSPEELVKTHPEVEGIGNRDSSEVYLDALRDHMATVHADCSGHAAYVSDPRYGMPEVYFVCLTPEVHAAPASDDVETGPVDDSPAGGDTDDAQRQEQEAAARAEREAREEEARRIADLQLRLGARAPVRHQFLHDVVHDEDAAEKIAAHWLRERIKTSLRSGLNRAEALPVFARILLPNLPGSKWFGPNVEFDAKELNRLIDKALSQKPTATLACLWLIAQNIDKDALFMQAQPNPSRRWEADAWAKNLTETFGYELGEAETELLDEMGERR